MREFKFRAWHTLSRYWIADFMDNPYLIQAGLDQLFNRIDHIKVMQFTGFKDKNGKEVYEGDIIEFFNPNTGKVLHYIVNWNNRDACFQFGDSGGWKFQSWLESVNGTMKIIGNMYENPELVKP